MKLLFSGLEERLNPETHRLTVKYETERAVKRIIVDFDMSLTCYLHIWKKKKSDNEKFSLVLDIIPLSAEQDSARVCSTLNTGNSGCSRSVP